MECINFHVFMLGTRHGTATSEHTHTHTVILHLFGWHLYSFVTVVTRSQSFCVSRNVHSGKMKWKEEPAPSRDYCISTSRAARAHTCARERHSCNMPSVNAAEATTNGKQYERTYADFGLYISSLIEKSWKSFFCFFWLSFFVSYSPTMSTRSVRR